MSEATERIGQLWSALSQLREATDDQAAIERLQALIAQIDGQIGQLDQHRSRPDFVPLPRSINRHCPPHP